MSSSEETRKMNRMDLPASHRLIDRILELLHLLSPLVGRDDPAGLVHDAVRLAHVDQLDHDPTHAPDHLDSKKERYQRVKLSCAHLWSSSMSARACSPSWLIRRATMPMRSSVTSRRSSTSSAFPFMVCAHGAA